MTSTTLTPPTTGRRHASWANLGLTYVLGLALLTIQSLGYHHWSHGDNQLSSDIPFYVVSGLIGVAIAAIGIARVRRSRRVGTSGTVGTVLGVLAVVIFPIAYYMPITVVCGATAFLLSRDAGPGRTATAARLLGLLAIACQVAVVVARVCGVTYQVGG